MSVKLKFTFRLPEAFAIRKLNDDFHTLQSVFIVNVDQLKLAH
jgi:hypothetical protein